MSAQLSTEIERPAYGGWYVGAMERLVGVVQELSQARDLPAIMAIVRTAARELTGADGATFVLRDGDRCFYADEDAISPLWKGQRFPMKICISGWVMEHAEPAVIEDIYQDPRIPAAAYRPTFVNSLAMVPIRAEKPVGAIGNYWARRHRPTAEELAILQSLAHVTSVAMENVDLYARLQQKVAALETSNRELSSFAWAASHDLKTPLRGVDNLARWIEDDLASGRSEDTRKHIDALRRRVRRMETLLDAILEYSHVERELDPAQLETVGGEVLREDLAALVDLPTGFTLTFSERFDAVRAPRVAVLRVLAGLVGNAIKHHDLPAGTIEVDAEDRGEFYSFAVRDDGPGIPPEFRARIFEMFQSLQPRDVKEGTGLGLALVRKILSLFGGGITVEAGPGRGSVFRFTWPKELRVDVEAA